MMDISFEKVDSILFVAVWVMSTVLLLVDSIVSVMFAPFSSTSSSLSLESLI